MGLRTLRAVVQLGKQRGNARASWHPRGVDDSAKARRRAVVKVQARTDPPDFDQPWARRGIDDATGSGFVVETEAGPRVLTNAHVIDHATRVELRRYGDASRYVGTLERVSHACDLALVAVEDPAFFRGVPAYPWGPSRTSATRSPSSATRSAGSASRSPGASSRGSR